ncbi:hypothetical protein POJ06DRAFT_258311 [Lipomyces tetrasporus]|uniref:Protein PXR1 n=1 Tax=Lipomyces tetrasporus TaxID=54092 RepID=A0AAD7QPC7_9ASCO|nr:uncharacterized protein POJ06DRAFT_258311 [Lipomyces tetrasporus]KAJ8098909.1 hypothetical protein POJ06DRAFT_258311 [Lipomyces tetrasporus]
MVGLAGPRNRQKIAHDPRNTTWSNDTDRFGHRHLSNLGWKPGSGLGLSAASRSITTHVKIKLKDDNLGLGASIAKANQDAASWAPGLDSFQELLSRLNSGTNSPSTEEKSGEEGDGKETLWETETKKGQTYNRLGKWGARIKFVRGERLGATIDDQTLRLSRKQCDEVTIGRPEVCPTSNMTEAAKAKKSKKSRDRHAREGASDIGDFSSGQTEQSSKSDFDDNKKEGKKRKHRREDGPDVSILDQGLKKLKKEKKERKERLDVNEKEKNGQREKGENKKNKTKRKEAKSKEKAKVEKSLKAADVTKEGQTRQDKRDCQG